MPDNLQQDPAIQAMDAEALSLEYAEQVTDSLSEAGIDFDEIQRSTDIAAHFVSVAVGLLQQDPGFQSPDNADAVYLAFNIDHCRKVLELFTHAIVHASLKSQELQLFGEPKSVILQSLAQDAFFQAKQLVAATVGQENTPNVQFTDEQLVEYIEQMVASSLHHYIGEYEQTHGSIHGEMEESGQSFGPRKQAQPPEHQDEHSQHPPDSPSQQYSQQTFNPPPSYPQHAHDPSGKINHSQEAPVSDIPPIQIKLAALSLYLSTQSEESQAEWKQQFPKEYHTHIDHYRNIDNIAAELPMQAVIDQLNAFTETIKASAHTPAARHDRVRRSLYELLQHPDNRQLLEGVMLQERPQIQRLFKHLGRIDTVPKLAAQLPMWSEGLEVAMLEYYQTLLERI